MEFKEVGYEGVDWTHNVWSDVSEVRKLSN